MSRIAQVVFPVLMLSTTSFCPAADEPGPKKEPPQPETWCDAWKLLPDVVARMRADAEKAREEEGRKQVAENLRKLSEALGKLQKEGKWPPKEGQKMPPGYPFGEEHWNNMVRMQLDKPPQRSPYEYLAPHIQNYLTPSDPFGSGNVKLEPAGGVLASQLRLPKGQGQVVAEVSKDSAAEKAGLKAHDVLLEVDGQPAPADADVFQRLLTALKPDAKVAAVVLREGKRVELKGLPRDALKPRPAPFGNSYRAPFDGTSNTLLLGDGSVRFLGGHPWAGDWKRWTGGQPSDGYEVLSKEPVLATLFREGGRVTGRMQEGSLVMTVVMTVKDNKATAELIKVQDGSAAEQRYGSLDKVPAEYRGKATRLLKAAERKPADPSDW